MTRVDIENLVPYVDSVLYRGGDGLGMLPASRACMVWPTFSMCVAAFLHMSVGMSSDRQGCANIPTRAPYIGARSAQLHAPDGHDGKFARKFFCVLLPCGPPVTRMACLCVQLLKPIVYGQHDSDEFVCDMLSTLTLHRPYPTQFHTDLLKTIHEHLSNSVENPGEFWKMAHTRMCTRITDEIKMRKTEKVTDDMFAAMVESVAATDLNTPEDVYSYVHGGLEWIMEDWQTPRAAFLGVLMTKAKQLDREQSGDM
jgi:hypothetical protein